MIIPSCMTANKLSKFALTVILLGIWSTQGRAEPVSESPLSFSLEKTSLTLHEPVIVKVRIVNRVSRPIDADLGLNNKENFVITITTPQGKKAQSHNPPREGMSFFGQKHLEPGERYSGMLVLNEWFTFEELGTYQIGVRLATPITSDGKPVTTNSFLGSFEVTDRDPARLDAICRRLVQQVKSAKADADADEAVFELSHVQDPLAIPYLEEVSHLPAGSTIVLAEALSRLRSRLGKDAPGTTSSVEEGPVTFFLTKPTVTLHEPVQVRVQIVNPTSQGVDVDLGDDRLGNFAVVITTPEGKQIQCSPPHRGGQTSPGAVHLEPEDGVYSQMLVLNEWFKFDELGIYKIEVRLQSPIHSKDTDLQTASFSSYLKVTDRSPKDLTAICQKLLNRIKNSDSYDDATQAALTLSYVEDPVAIPYLKRAVAYPMVADIATEGLKRIEIRAPISR